MYRVAYRQGNHIYRSPVITAEDPKEASQAAENAAQATRDTGRQAWVEPASRAA